MEIPVPVNSRIGCAGGFHSGSHGGFICFLGPRLLPVDGPRGRFPSPLGGIAASLEISKNAAIRHKPARMGQRGSSGQSMPFGNKCPSRDLNR